MTIVLLIIGLIFLLIVAILLLINYKMFKVDEYYNKQIYHDMKYYE